MIIDDSPVVRLFLKHTLEGFEPDCVIEAAANGVEGLARLEKESFDLVFCDLNMPLLGGREFCSALREKRETRQQQVVIFTSEFMSRADPQFVNDPNIVFLPKPASRLQICEVVTQMLAA